MLLSLGMPILRREDLKVLSRIPLFLLLCVTLGPSQKAQKDASGLPKYDLHAPTKTKGVVDEVLFPLGTRKDSTELIIKSGDNKMHIYVCAKPFQGEMGIIFSLDEIAVTDSKVRKEGPDVILARELVKRRDTLLFRDDKGKRVLVLANGQVTTQGRA